MPLRAMVVDDADNETPRGVPFSTVALAHLVITTSGRVLKSRNDGRIDKRKLKRAVRLLGIKETN